MKVTMEEVAPARAPALQVIILGSGGGPLEDNTTAFLARSISSGWGRGSLVAVDAGVHLAAITRILEQTQPPSLSTSLANSSNGNANGAAADANEVALPHTLTSGPFAGLEIPHASPSANADHIARSLIDTYLITHPHLDHISGFVIGTAAKPGSRPKRVAALPSTISALKNHVFNNVIWPNLSDENNGVGLVTYMRLVEGGSPAVGDGEGKGYLEISDGLSVKAWAVSHGHCIERHNHRGSTSSSGTPGTRYGSFDAGVPSPRTVPHSHHAHPHPSLLNLPSTPGAPMSRAPSMHAAAAAAAAGITSGDIPGERVCVYDSSAYFLRDVATGREVLIFGDVEPDSISLSPRNHMVWRDAAPKIVAGSLAAVLIECSYDDSQSVDRLFGHLKPVFLMEELRALATEVEAVRRSNADMEASMSGSGILTRKRKRDLAGAVATDGAVDDEDVPPGQAPPRRRTTGGKSEDAVSPKTLKPPRGSSILADEIALGQTSHLSTPTAELSLAEVERQTSAPAQPPLKGLKVVVIHMKDKLCDGPSVSDNILEELLEQEKEENLGCEFVISHVGQSLLL